MFAVIRTGGKQYRVRNDDVIRVERLAVEPGATVALDEVLILDSGAGVRIGSPLVAGARVEATVLDQTRAPKILVFKKKRRKNHRRLRGHRQDLTVLRIMDIAAGAAVPPVDGASEAARETAEAAVAAGETS